MLNTHIKHWFWAHWAPKERSRSLGWTAMTVMILASSTYNTFAKILTDVLSPITLVFLSEFLTGFFVLFSFGTVPTIKRLWTIDRKYIPPLVAIGLLSGVIAPLLWFTGLHRTSVVNAALFGNTEMLFLTLFAVVFLHERFGKAHFLSMFTIVVGLAVIVLKGFSESVEFQLGDALIVLSSAAYGGGSSVFRRYLSHADPHIVMFVRSSISVIVFFLISPLLPHPLISDITAFPMQALPVLIGFAFVSRFLNVFSFYEALERLPLTTVSFALNLPVIGAVLFGALVLNEKIMPYHIVGGIFIIAGALMLELAGIHKSEKHLENHLKQGNPSK